MFWKQTNPILRMGISFAEPSKIPLSQLPPLPGSDQKIPYPVQNVHLTVFEGLDLRAPEDLEVKSLSP